MCVIGIVYKLANTGNRNIWRILSSRGETFKVTDKREAAFDKIRIRRIDS